MLEPASAKMRQQAVSWAMGGRSPARRVNSGIAGSSNAPSRSGRGSSARNPPAARPASRVAAAAPRPGRTRIQASSSPKRNSTSPPARLPRSGLMASSPAADTDKPSARGACPLSGLATILERANSGESAG